MLNTRNSNCAINKKEEKIIKYAKLKLQEMCKLDSISRLEVLRNKNIAHLDKKYQLGLKSFKIEEQFAYKNTEELINFAYDVIKNAMQLIYNATIEDNKTYEIIQLQYNSIIEIIEKYPKILEENIELKLNK